METIDANSDIETLKNLLLQKENELQNLPYTGTFITSSDQAKRIGGIDISYPTNENILPTIGYSIYESSTNKISYSKTKQLKQEESPDLPYIPGFLGHKEAHIMCPFIENCHEHDLTNHKADVILVDGNGYLHSRKFGSACHVFKRLNIPIIGVAKNLLHVDGVTPSPKDDGFKNRLQEKLVNFGDYFIYSKSDTNEEIVAVVKTSKSKGCSKPVFVSIGGGIDSLDLAVKIVISCCDFKIPEPIRNADLSSRELLRKIESQQ